MKYLASVNAVANMRRLEDIVPETEVAEMAPMVDAAEEIECVDGTGVDSYGDGCNWYVQYPNECGWWDSDDFSAVE